MEFIAVTFILTTLVLLYLTPTVIAHLRCHSNFKAIAALNILTGWSALGWVASFVWALTDNVRGSHG
jgi:hypothetical protein